MKLGCPAKNLSSLSNDDRTVPCPPSAECSKEGINGELHPICRTTGNFGSAGGDGFSAPADSGGIAANLGR